MFLFLWAPLFKSTEPWPSCVLCNFCVLKFLYIHQPSASLSKPLLRKCHGAINRFQTMAEGYSPDFLKSLDTGLTNRGYSKVGFKITNYTLLLLVLEDINWEKKTLVFSLLEPGSTTYCTSLGYLFGPIAKQFGFTISAHALVTKVRAMRVEGVIQIAI